MIFDIILAVIVVFAVAIGLHRGLFDQLLTWVQIFFLFIFPGLVAAPLMNTGLGSTFKGMFNFRLPEVAVNFINSKVLEHDFSVWSSASDWLSSFLGQLVIQAIIFVIMLVLMIVGFHFAGHYIKKYRNLRKSFRRFDTIAGGVFGILFAFGLFVGIMAVVAGLPASLGLEKMISSGFIAPWVYGWFAPEATASLAALFMTL